MSCKAVESGAHGRHHYLMIGDVSDWTIIVVEDWLRTLQVVLRIGTSG